MSSPSSKLASSVIALVMLFAVFAPSALAQDTYPPVVPADPGPSGDEILLLSQSDQALLTGQGAANSGDAIGAQDAADDISALLARARSLNASAATIAQLEAALASATRTAATAGASVPAAPPLALPEPALAFTGGSVSIPLAAGAILVGAGGLTLLAARKREQNF